MALSDTASRAIHLRRLIEAQGYEVGPCVLFQDNLSCMALIKKGGPCSDRSRHIHIRHFWVKDAVDAKEAKLVHKGTEEMWANLLTKPVQGKQFETERRGMTNWV